MKPMSMHRLVLFSSLVVNVVCGCITTCPTEGCGPPHITLALQPAISDPGHYVFSVTTDTSAVEECEVELPSNGASNLTCSAGLGLDFGISVQMDGASVETPGPQIARVIVAGRFAQVTLQVTHDGQPLFTQTISPVYADEQPSGACGACPRANAVIDTRQ